MDAQQSDTKKTTRDTPIFKAKVLRIVKLREKGRTFDEIATQVGGTRMGVWYLYKRWKDWGLEQIKVKQ